MTALELRDRLEREGILIPTYRFVQQQCCLSNGVGQRSPFIHAALAWREPPIFDDLDFTIEMPGKIARHLTVHTADLGETERQTLQQGREMRRGQGYSLHVTAPPHVHWALLAAAETVGASTSAADRKAYRIYRDRLHNATT